MLRGVGSRVAGFLALAALTAMPLPAAAETPDGQHHPEAACDGRTGAAMACARGPRSDGLRQHGAAASATACNKVYSNFLRLTGQARRVSARAPRDGHRCSRRLRTRTWKSPSARSATTVASALWIPAVRLNLVNYRLRAVLHRLERGTWSGGLGFSAHGTADLGMPLDHQQHLQPAVVGPAGRTRPRVRPIFRS